MGRQVQGHGAPGQGLQGHQDRSYGAPGQGLWGTPGIIKGARPVCMGGKASNSPPNRHGYPAPSSSTYPHMVLQHGLKQRMACCATAHPHPLLAPLPQYYNVLNVLQCTAIYYNTGHNIPRYTYLVLLHGLLHISRHHPAVVQVGQVLDVAQHVAAIVMVRTHRVALGHARTHAHTVRHRYRHMAAPYGNGGADAQAMTHTHRVSLTQEHMHTHRDALTRTHTHMHTHTHKHTHTSTHTCIYAHTWKPHSVDSKRVVLDS